MLDYLVAIFIALVGLGVIWLVFASVSSADVTVAEPTAANRKPRSKKQARGPSRKYKEDVLDQETEQLIAEDVARSSSGLSKDVKVVEPTTLEEVRSRHQVHEAQRASPANAQAANASERERRIDKELGFQSTDRKQKKEKKSKPVEKQFDAMDEDDMDRKLAQFFRNSKGRNRPAKLNLEEDTPASGTGTGGRVAIKGDITNARTWQ